MNVIRVLAALVPALLCTGGTGWSQPYPAKPVRVVVPFPPGGANDIVGRILLPKLSEHMGQSFVIDNRAGAGGTIGTAIVAQSRPDGYTLLIQTAASHASNPHLYKKLPYDALNDFAPIAPLGRLVAVLTVHPSLPVRSTKELIAFAKKHPDEILFGHAGYGSFIHLNTVLMRDFVEAAENCFEFRLDRGQIFFLNNHLIAHGRTSFVDAPSSDRLLLRFWLRPHGGVAFEV